MTSTFEAGTRGANVKACRRGGGPKIGALAATCREPRINRKRPTATKTNVACDRPSAETAPVRVRLKAAIISFLRRRGVVCQTVRYNSYTATTSEKHGTAPGNVPPKAGAKQIYP